MKSILDQLSVKMKKNFIRYAAGLILGSEKRTCTSIARIFGIKHDSIYRIFGLSKLLITWFPSFMVDITIYFSKKKDGWIIVDDTSLSKKYAKLIQGISYVYDTALGRTQRSISIVVIAWSNGYVTVPIGFKCWITKEFSQEDYKTKIQLAQKLIADFSKRGFPFKYLLADGLYFSIDMLSFLDKHKIKFEMRAHSNRKVTHYGINTQLRWHPSFKLIRNQRCLTRQALWHGHKIFFTVCKRKNKKGEYNIVFLASNINTTAENHIAIYEQRWVIESMFRTMKQRLGIAHCAIQDFDKQKMHIYTVFYVYAFLQHEKIKHNLPNPESVAYALRDAKSSNSIRRINTFNRNFHVLA